MTAQLICTHRTYYPNNRIDPFGYIHTLFFQGMMSYDRFNIVTQYSGLNYIKVDDHDTLVNNNYSFSFRELLDTRVKYILDRAERENKLIVVLWSGGIDSSFIITALLANKSISHRIEVVCNDTSLKDCNKEFFEFLKKTGINIRVLHNHVLVDLVEKTYKNDYLCVTGVASDQMQMMGKLLDKGCGHLLPLPWEDAIEQYISINEWDSYFKRHRFSKEIIKSKLDKFPIPIKTWAQFGMFWNNNMKSRKVIYDNLLLANTDYFRNNEIAFFNTKDFLNWALCYIMPKFEHTKLDTDITEYKSHLKEYVVDVTGIESFRYMRKTKSHWHDITDNVFRVLDTDGVHDLGHCSTFNKYERLQGMYPLTLTKE